MRPSDLIRREPNLFAAELAWRWSFALGAAAVLMFVVRRIGGTLNLIGIFDVGNGGAGAIERAQMMAQAIARALPLVGATVLFAALAIALIWMVAAMVGRGIVMRGIVRRIALEAGSEVAPRFSWIAMCGAHFARVFSLIVLVIGYLLAAIAEGRVLSSDPAFVADPTSVPAPGTLLGVLLAFALVMGFAVAAWAMVHFVASLAPIFIARDGRGTLDALADAVKFALRRWRTLLSEAMQNSTARSLVALAISAAAILVGATLVRRSAILAWILIGVLSFAYCVLSDWFLLMRVVAYVQVAEEDRRSITVAMSSEGTSPH